jgi:hypothetical protein
MNPGLKTLSVIRCVFLLALSSCGEENSKLCECRINQIYLHVSLSVFTDEPARELVKEFLGAEAELDCSVSPSYLVGWEINFPGGKDSVRTLNLSLEVIEQLEGRGIMVQNTSSVDSMLTINGTEGNNGTVVQCIAANEDTPTVIILAQERVEIYFYSTFA